MRRIPLPPRDFCNGTTQINGAVLPSGTRTILFMGRHGKGPCSYISGGGPTAPNIEPYVWAYDVNDLLAVKAGTKAIGSVRPTSTFRLPNVTASGIGGVAVDPATHRIFVTEHMGDGTKPRIHVFTISGTPTSPQIGR